MNESRLQCHEPFLLRTYFRVLLYGDAIVGLMDHFLFALDVLFDERNLRAQMIDCFLVLVNVIL